MATKKAVSMHDQARELYFSSPDLDCTIVAAQLGIELETVRYWAKKEGWYTKRTLEQLADLPDDISDQADAIRLVLMSSIVGGEHGGKDLATLVDAWKSTLDIRKSEAGVDRDEIIDDETDD